MKYWCRDSVILKRKQDNPSFQGAYSLVEGEMSSELCVQLLVFPNISEVYKEWREHRKMTWESPNSCASTSKALKSWFHLKLDLKDKQDLEW